MLYFICVYIVRNDRNIDVQSIIIEFVLSATGNSFSYHIPLLRVWGLFNKNIRVCCNLTVKSYPNGIHIMLLSSHSRPGYHQSMYSTYFVIVLIWFWCRLILPISLRVTSLALGQSHGYNNASGGTLQNMIKWITLTYWGQDKMAAISQTVFLSAFSWMKTFEFEIKFHRNMFLMV